MSSAKKILVVLCSVFSVPASAQEPEARLLDQVVQLEMNASGLQAVADYVRASSLPDINDMHLPDVEDTVDGGVEVKASGLHLWANFGALTLAAGDQTLAGVQQIVHIRMHADEIRMRKKVLGNWVSTTCDDTDITAGNSESVSLYFAVRASVQGRSVQIAEDRTDFTIPEDQFEVDGPRRCSGALGVGSLIRLAAHSILKRSRGTIEDAVENRVREFVPQIGTALNQAISRTFELDLNQPPLVSGRVRARTFPYALQLQQGLLSVTVGTDLERIHEAGSEREATSEVPEALEGVVDIGAAGVNPAIITEAFQTIFPQGMPWTALDDNAAPGLSDALDVSSASGIWPDLHEIPLTSRKLRLKVRLARAPLLAVGQPSTYVSARIPQLELMFMAQINGAWKDYFLLRIDFSSGLLLQRSGSWLSLRMAGPKQLHVGGIWAAGYTPVNPLFEQEVAELIFSSIIDYLYDSGPLTVIEVPRFVIGGMPISAGDVGLASPYIRLRLQRE